LPPGVIYFDLNAPNLISAKALPKTSLMGHTALPQTF